jgi:hypothetical protein
MSIASHLNSLGYHPLKSLDSAGGDDRDLVKALGLRLPDDYATFLRAFPSTGVFDSEIVFRGEAVSPWASNGQEILSVLFASSQIATSDLLHVRKTYLDQLPSHLLVIGKVEGSNPVCLDTSAEGFGQIFVWDHECDSDYVSGLYRVCKGFDTFVSLLRSESTEEDSGGPKLVSMNLSDSFKKKAAEILAKKSKK